MGWDAERGWVVLGENTVQEPQATELVNLDRNEEVASDSVLAGLFPVFFDTARQLT
jgi:hypothetical protein